MRKFNYKRLIVMLVGMSMAAYRNILLNVISSCLG